jgi:hypothetical protein
VHDDGECYETVGNLIHVDERGRRHVVESGYVTDLASVPRMARALVPCAGLHTYPSILHDDRCDAVNAGDSELTSREVDREFRHAMRSLGVQPLRRWVMWAGVRLGALASDTRRPGILPDLPGVFAIVLLVAPIYLPALLINALAQTVDGFAGWMAVAACRAFHAHDEATLLDEAPNGMPDGMPSGASPELVTA